MATLALGFPSLVGGGKLSQTSDRLYSCGFPDRQSRPWSATGAGGFEVLIANCKWKEVLKSLVFVDMVESEVGSATDWTPGVGGHGAVLAFS